MSKCYYNSVNAFVIGMNTFCSENKLANQQKSLPMPSTFIEKHISKFVVMCLGCFCNSVIYLLFSFFKYLCIFFIIVYANTTSGFTYCTSVVRFIVTKTINLRTCQCIYVHKINKSVKELIYILQQLNISFIICYVYCYKFAVFVVVFCLFWGEGFSCARCFSFHWNQISKTAHNSPFQQSTFVQNVISQT